MSEDSLSDELKVDIIDKIGEHEFRLVEGANERIQLEALIARLTKLRG
jgi:replication factor C small subunit